MRRSNLTPKSSNSAPRGIKEAFTVLRINLAFIVWLKLI